MDTNTIRVQVTEKAAADLRKIARELRAAGAKEAARYVMRCVKSVDGARRHALRLQNEAENEARG